MPRRRAWSSGIVAFATLVVASGNALAGAPAADPAAGADPTYRETVDVRELEVTVALPEGVGEERRRKLSPADLQVLDDGRAAPITRVDPLVPGDGALRAGPWSIVVYVDRVLADGDTVARGIAALAERAGQLVRLGRVEVVVADPAPRTVLAPSQDPEAVRNVLLANVQSTAARWKQLGEIRVDGSPEAVLLQGARLLAAVAERDLAGPRALILLADVEAAAGEPADPSTLVPFARPGEAIAAYGWTVATLALPPPPAPPSKAERPPQVDEHERFRAEAQGSRREVTFKVGGGAGGPDLDLERALENAFAPRAALVRTVARTSGGALLQTADALDRLLADLGRRVRVVYRAGGVADGRPRPVEVRWLADDQVLVGPRFRRSGTPEQAARARATVALVDQLVPARTLTALPELVAVEGGFAVVVGLGPGQEPGGDHHRLTVGYGRADGGVEVAVEALAPGTAWPVRSSVVIPLSARQVVVMVENLASGASTSTLLSVPGGR